MHERALLIQDISELSLKLLEPIGRAVTALPPNLIEYAQQGTVPRLLWIIQREGQLSGDSVVFNKHSVVDNYVHDYVRKTMKEDLSVVCGNYLITLDRRYGLHSIRHEIKGRDLYTYYYN